MHTRVVDEEAIYWLMLLAKSLDQLLDKFEGFVSSWENAPKGTLLDPIKVLNLNPVRDS